MSNIYLCGPVTGNGQAVHSFKSVEEKIWNAAQNSGITIYTYNPVRICPPGFTWHLAMRVCVGELVRCHGIALLQGWQRSKGAALELKLAQDLHIPVVYAEPPFDYLDMSALFTAAPETLRYYNARLVQFHREGVEESLAEDRAAAELANRYLDPYGFEYIDIGEEG
jgi:hypothetical protein